MSYSSNQTRERILDCALQEFKQYGYQNANMRRIAQTAKATTGALYNHFANKAVLFDALVQGPAEDMLGQFQELHRQTVQQTADISGGDWEDAGRSGADWMLDYIYEHMDAFRLIFCHSEGTQWSGYLEQLIEIEEQAYRTYFDALGKPGKQVEDFFLHITSASGFQYMVEIVAHDLPYEKAVAVMNNLKRFSLAGWHEMLGF